MVKAQTQAHSLFCSIAAVANSDLFLAFCQGNQSGKRGAGNDDTEPFQFSFGANP